VGVSKVLLRRRSVVRSVVVGWLIYGHVVLVPTDASTGCRCLATSHAIDR